jgi:hypothetical protein
VAGVSLEARSAAPFKEPVSGASIVGPLSNILCFVILYRDSSLRLVCSLLPPPPPPPPPPPAAAAGRSSGLTRRGRRRRGPQVIEKFELTIDIDRLIEETDTDCSGKIDYEEFKAMLS